MKPLSNKWNALMLWMAGLVLVSSISTCLKPEIIELDFFSVSMLEPTASEIDLGTLILQGNIVKDELSQIDSLGFYVFTEPINMNSVPDTIILAGLSGSNGFFEAVLENLSLTTTYYFKAFASGFDERINERRKVLSKENPARSFSFSLNFSMYEPEVKNNTARLKSTLMGQNNLNIPIDDHGFLYSLSYESLDTDPFGQEKIAFGTGTNNLEFDTLLTGLEFNTSYYFLVYALSANGTKYISTIDTIYIRGGWEYLGDFGTTLIRGSSASSGGYGYIIGGCQNPNNCNQTYHYGDILYKYDPANNNWEELMTSGFGFPRKNATAFVLNDNHFYLGFGRSGGGPLKDIDQIDLNSTPLQWDGFNAAIQVAAREGAVSFVLDNKVYVGTGKLGTDLLDDFWEYDPNTHSWASMDPFEKAMTEGVAFVVNQGTTDERAFVGGGLTTSGIVIEFYEFLPPSMNPPKGKWIHHSNFEGLPRSGSVSFSIGDKGYVCTGVSEDGQTRHFDTWEFNANPGPEEEVWTEKDCIPGLGRDQAVAFTIDGIGYLGTGQTGTGPDAAVKDFFKFVRDSL